MLHSHEDVEIKLETIEEEDFCSIYEYKDLEPCSQKRKLEDEVDEDDDEKEESKKIQTKKRKTEKNETDTIKSKESQMLKRKLEDDSDEQEGEKLERTGKSKKQRIVPEN
ncbi:hypothetical protein BD560DRAFT_489099 [Blakeslea trispora]|nr:hypothetical protein BD560DRAFT_489099 [Blakeslea trispora]